MKDIQTRNAVLLFNLVRLTPNTNKSRVDQLCVEYDIDKSDVISFFEPKPEDRLFTVDMRPVDLILFDSEGNTTYIESEGGIEVSGDTNQVLADLKLYKLIV